MNIPENTKPFNLAHAQQGAPLLTRDGRTAKFIAYVPENNETWQVVSSLNGEISCYNSDGKYYKDGDDSQNDLFMEPLGYCEGLPVFVGDVLISHYGTEYTVYCDVTTTELEVSKWPSKVPVVETRMEWGDLCKAYDPKPHNSFTWSSTACKNLANKAIERSIADGDVIPTSVFVKMANSAYENRFSGVYVGIFKDSVDEVLKDYLDGLK